MQESGDMRLSVNYFHSDWGGWNFEKLSWRALILTSFLIILKKKFFTHPYEVERIGPDQHSTDKEDDSIAISAGRTKHYRSVGIQREHE